MYFGSYVAWVGSLGLSLWAPSRPVSCGSYSWLSPPKALPAGGSPPPARPQAGGMVKSASRHDSVSSLH